MSQEMVEFLLEEASQARRQAVDLGLLLVTARLLAGTKTPEAGLVEHLATSLAELSVGPALEDLEAYFQRVDAIEAAGAGPVADPPRRVHLEDEAMESLLLWLETAEYHAELVRGGASPKQREANRQDFEDLGHEFEPETVGLLARALIERLKAT
ncbi:MAG: hypothetical protein AB7S38_39735 [Vulcanimicrobiota bacterium]